MSDRLKYEKGNKYCNKVLIGTWYEELQHYIQKRYIHGTTYDQTFIPKESSSVHPDVIWNHKIRSEGYGARILLDHERDKYHNNLSTTYDLSYNHIPKWSKFDKIYKRYDMSNNYGNVTDYGLRVCKKEQWKSEKIDPPPVMITEMKDCYRPYQTKDYNLDRKAIPCHNSSRLLEVNKALSHLPLRGNPALIAPDSLVKMPKTYTCPMYIKSLS